MLRNADSEFSAGRVYPTRLRGRRRRASEAAKVVLIWRHTFFVSDDLSGSREFTRKKIRQHEGHFFGVGQSQIYERVLGVLKSSYVARGGVQISRFATEYFFPSKIQNVSSFPAVLSSIDSSAVFLNFFSNIFQSVKLEQICDEQRLKYEYLVQTWLNM